VFSDSSSDAQRALTRGDFRLLAVRGYSVEAPGTDFNYGEARRRFGTLEIDGTSDDLAWPWDGYLNDRARDYAAKYNRIIVSAHSEGAISGERDAP
jgi:hypothetical protein